MDKKEEEQSNFKILNNYYKSQMVSFFEKIPTIKSLIIEDTLLPVINHMLVPIPDSARVAGCAELIADKVSIFNTKLIL